MNAFKTLGIEPRLALSDEAMRDAFREAGKLAHPDAGGEEASFAKLREAFEIVSSPSRRLRHWLELRGITVQIRGTVDPAIMDLFSHVGEATQHAEALIRRRDEAKSALTRALLERETQICREEVERALVRVEDAIGSQCTQFPEFENAPDLESAAAAVRNLAFLEKWRATLRGLFSRLI
jgi:curved DNA-binding protein CbpA